MKNCTRTLFVFALALALVHVAQAQITVYTAILSGPNEAPPNASPGTGLATVTLNETNDTMRVEVTFSGLTGTVTASHIHAATAVAGTGTAGVATTTPTFTGFPSGVSSGSYDNTFDMTQASSYNPTYLTNHGGTTAQAQADLFAAIAAGQAYLNIHSTTFTGGEIRGFLTAVPEPSAYAAILGAGGLALALRHRRPKIGATG